MALPSPDALTALAKLTSDPNNIVYIVSGRDQAFLEEHLGHFSRLGMSAEHGGFIRSPDSATWMNFTASLDMGWMEEVAEIFRYYTERTTGSHIEMKKSSITWHYRSSDPEWGCVFFYFILYLFCELLVLGSSNVGSARIYWRTT